MSRLWIVLPALLFIIAWGFISPALVTMSVLADPAASSLPAFGMQRETILAEAHAVATGAAAGVFNPDARALVEPFREALGRMNAIGITATLIISFLGGTWAFLRLRPDFRARTRVERIVMMIAAARLAGRDPHHARHLRFAAVRNGALLPHDRSDLVPVRHPLEPGPMSSIEGADPSSFGAIPLFWGTIFIGAIIAMIVAIPLGLMSAIYLTQYASPAWRRWLKPALEVLAGVPTVVYGYFAALTVAPAIRDIALSVGIPHASSESALAAGLVMGVMIIPFVSSMADDSIAAVPQAMRDGSLAMGATKSRRSAGCWCPPRCPAIVAGVMLAVSRAIGETMIVVMAAGYSANLTANPFETMTTVTEQIVAMLTGEASSTSRHARRLCARPRAVSWSRLALNIVALRVVKRYREAYD